MRQTGGSQAFKKPLRQRSSFKTDPLDLIRWILQGRSQIIKMTNHLTLVAKLTGLVANTNGCLFLPRRRSRYSTSCYASFPMLVAVARHDHVYHHCEAQHLLKFTIVKGRA